LRVRKQDKDERDEQESLLDLYLRAMERALSHLGSGLIDQSQKATAAAMQIAEK
jgi:hypothetical protein